MKPVLRSAIVVGCLIFPLVPTSVLAANADEVEGIVERLNALVVQQETRIRELEGELLALRGHMTAPHSAGSSVDPSAPARTYFIQEGDTITRIAEKHEVPRSRLMAVNGLKEGQQIYIGDPLIIPHVTPAPRPNGAAGKPSQPAPQKKSGSTPQKTVGPKPTPDTAPKGKPGSPNSGKQVAKKDSTPKTTAKSDAAPKKTAAPQPKAPAPTESKSSGPIVYTVQYGDSLFHIARKYGTTVDAIMSANKISNANQIKGGQKLEIPVGATGSKLADKGKPAAGKPTTQPSKPAPATDTNMTGKETFGVYTVQKGDTLWSLSRDFFCTHEEIQKLNELGKSTTLRPGQELVVPTSKYFEVHKDLAAN